MYLICKKSIMLGLIMIYVMQSPVAFSQEATPDDVSKVDAHYETEVDSPITDPFIDEPQTLKINNYLFGDWNGWRNKAADKGVTFDIQFTQHLQSVTDGGVNKTGRYGGAVDYLVEFDLGKMGIQEGAFVKVLAESRYGRSVNGDAGSVLPTNTDMSFPLTDKLDEDILLTITELSFMQFFSPSFGVMLGKFQTLDGDANEFASGRGRSQFMNANLIFNPVTSLVVPYSTLGAGVVYLPSPRTMITSTLMNS